MLRPKYWHHKGWRYNKTNMQPNSPTPQPYNRPEELENVENPLAVMQPGERVICHIRRHPFGLISIYFMSALLLVLAFAGAAAATHYLTDLTSQQKLWIFAAAVFFSIGVLLYMWIASIIYNGNRWIVTSDSITQISQVGLFNKQTSQLSLGNLEDVTFEQQSVVQSLFGFGTLHVETAGEKSKFVFPFCPKPDHCAREIIQAHEQFMAANPENERRDNQGLTQPGGVQQNPSVPS